MTDDRPNEQRKKRKNEQRNKETNITAKGFNFEKKVAAEL